MKIETFSFFIQLLLEPNTGKREISGISSSYFSSSLQSLTKYLILQWIIRLAERVGFEPTLEFPLNTLSKRAPSATRPSLRRKVGTVIIIQPSCCLAGTTSTTPQRDKTLPERGMRHEPGVVNQSKN